jgi:hypothetical protein
LRRTSRDVYPVIVNRLWDSRGHLSRRHRPAG